jgi:hypothetical protein
MGRPGNPVLETLFEISADAHELDSIPTSRSTAARLSAARGAIASPPLQRVPQGEAAAAAVDARRRGEDGRDELEDYRHEVGQGPRQDHAQAQSHGRRGRIRG